MHCFVCLDDDVPANDSVVTGPGSVKHSKQQYQQKISGKAWGILVCAYIIIRFRDTILCLSITCITVTLHTKC